MVAIMERIEIKISKSWERQLIEYFEDIEIMSHEYKRAALRQLGKLNRLLHEELIDQHEYDILSKESGSRGPGFDCTPEGWSLLVEWNNGMLEKMPRRLSLPR
jgi:hypothetical protein